jgi:hypothetical protein
MPAAVSAMSMAAMAAAMVIELQGSFLHVSKHD